MDPSLPPSPSEPDSEPAQLLDQLLQSLFDDFSFWFQRGLVLLELTPDALLPASEQQVLRQKLEEALQAIAATRALRAACSTPMAVDMDAMAPWHRLMMRVWNLSSMLRIAGVVLPPDGRGDAEPQA
ncbi:MAG: DUF2605 family protein [Cyanobacteria bacterium M_surface_7_m2_037]|nr:DUF2605 family protein [Cyanobacteria bacterium K_DeepCast_0m_m1_088]MBM5795427.1 DUF2605 family protein [Cyanobacteria bacterium M_surface_7_m2_037]MBM5819570.1 DUF2605 family protein [Cyanobacteria bacterium K_DeepCast_150m_m2_101]